MSQIAVCKICTRQISRYTCPSCNIPYCSSTCYKSQKHSNCVEGFFQREIQQEELDSNPGSKARERLKMMQMLRRFEENTGAEDLESEGEEEEDTDDLAHRFYGIDIASTHPTKIWSLLSPSERATFLQAIQNPDSDLANDLLESEEVKNDVKYMCWWEAEARSLPDTEDDNLNIGTHSRLPIPIKISSSMVRPNGALNGPPLIYNLCVICIAYAYTTRRLGRSPLSSSSQGEDWVPPATLIPAGDVETHPETYRDIEDARNRLIQLLPLSFLFDKKSTALYGDLDSAMGTIAPLTDTDVWDNPTYTNPSKSTNPLLIRDAATLLRPRVIAVVSSTPSSSDSSSTSETLAVDDYIDIQSHPNRTPVYMLSDLYRLFSSYSSTPSPEKNEQKDKYAHVTHKLFFYASHALSIPPMVFKSLADDLDSRAGATQAAMDTEITDHASNNSTFVSRGTRSGSVEREERKVLIEEITPTGREEPSTNQS